jgi:hypothetical protein
MKLATIFLTVAALIPASAQIAPQTSVAMKAGTIPGSEKPATALQMMGAVEKEMNTRLSNTAAEAGDPCYVLGAGSRGFLISGFGVVLSTELDLINTPGGGIFNNGISPALKVSVHKRKLAQVAALQQALKDMIVSIEASPMLKLADSDQVVVAVRLAYRSWEDVSGLPGQIVARLDHRGGTIKLDIQ